VADEVIARGRQTSKRRAFIGKLLHVIFAELMQACLIGDG